MRFKTLWLAAGLTGICQSTAIYALNSSLTVDLELTGFPSVESDSAAFTEDASIGLLYEFQNSFNDGNTIFSLTPFYRWDDQDDERSHGDIRELNLLHVHGNWEFLFGVGKVFWGVAESNHLIDIVNQTDLLEGFDGEDKLGQPMIRASRSFDQSTLTLFVLPGFRKREFLSPDNPLGFPFTVANEARYESSDEESHVDFAVRYSGYADIVDYGFSFFTGTAREPLFVAGDRQGQLIAFYPQMDQFGVDIQITNDAWLWKLEAVRRELSNDGYTAAVGGLEYSLFGLSDGAYDLGLLAEYHLDDRSGPSQSNFQNDLFAGMRFSWNDAESTELLAGGFMDQDDQSMSFRVEASRRMPGDIKLSVEAQSFPNVDPGKTGFSFRNSDFVRLTLEAFF